MKNVCLVILLFVSVSSFGQSFLNNYQYVIVDSKFDFVKEKDEYGSSSLVKHLFKKIGFKAFLDTDKLPEDLSEDACKALFVSAIKKSTMLTIKAAIEFKDCLGKTIYVSEIGKSKTKEFRRGYYQAINRAFQSIEKLNYQYTGSLATSPKPRKPHKTASKKTAQNSIVVDQNPKVPEKKEGKTKTPVNKVTDDLLYAQKNKEGFQLVNNKPEIVFTILKTGQENLYILKNRKGILIKKGRFWYAEYYHEGQLIVEKYKVKF